MDECHKVQSRGINDMLACQAARREYGDELW